MGGCGMSLYQEYDGSEDLKNLRVEVVRLKADRDEWRQKYWEAHDDFHRLWVGYSTALDAQPWATDEPIRVQLDRVTERLKRAEDAEAQLKQALSDIHTVAHCTAKAGPLNTPDLQEVWSKFMQIAVMATNGLVSTQPKGESNWKS